MVQVTLVPHRLQYAQAMSRLTSTPQIKEALGLSDEQTSLAGTKEFIRLMLEQERRGRFYSRVILDEKENLIGVITLKDIDHHQKTCHIGTWIGYPYWGKGYNQLAKKEILCTAFMRFDLEYVFAGANQANIRSIKAQEKLPYIRTGVEKEFPEEHRKLENQVKAPCILNVIEKATFLKWYNRNHKTS